MIGVDTNVLLRLFVRDDPMQERLAASLIEEKSDGLILVSDIVVAELAWTLRRRFKWTKPDVVALLVRLLGQAAFMFQDRAVVMAAIRAFEFGRADFAAYLIGARNDLSGVSSTFTFDQDAGYHRWFTLVTSEDFD